MTIVNFHIDYFTTWGQQVYICGSTDSLGNLNEDDALRLSLDGTLWHTQVQLPEYQDIQYYYLVKCDQKVIRREWGSNRHLRLDGFGNYHITDQWRDPHPDQYLFSSLFTKTQFSHSVEKTNIDVHNNCLIINVTCPYVGKDQHLFISGDSDMLGNWDADKALPLKYIDDAHWQLAVSYDLLPRHIDYKLFIKDSNTGEAIYWEYGDNRMFCKFGLQHDGSTAVVQNLRFNYPGFAYKARGTAIPLFSLRSDKSYGIGDFDDIMLMADWLAVTNQQVLQLLPINDTTNSHTWRDSYPYSAISIYALNPIYLACASLPLKNKVAQSRFNSEAKKLNNLAYVDYEAVADLKKRYTKILFNERYHSTMQTASYKQFVKTNDHWLFPYACFSTLRDHYGTTNFQNWQDHANYDFHQLKQMLSRNSSLSSQVDYWYFVQYLLHTQLTHAKNYAHKKGISLKGDIPIGINRNSVEAWTAPHLFNLDTQTGAPPDDFSVNGQNWAFPTYNWEAMEHEGYRWWINRFQKMADYFDAYRIDHILGFFRIWEIPITDIFGLTGHFYPALPFSPQELESNGIAFDRNRLIKPYITTSLLQRLFGSYTSEVVDSYLNLTAPDQYELKEFCNTQRKIMQRVDYEDDDKANVIREGLLQLTMEVLFVADPRQADMYHPRINAHSTDSYQQLDDDAKAAFNRLYDDFFFHRHNDFWAHQALKKLPPLLGATQMLPCGEDLGMIPQCVPNVMNTLQILSLELERMPKTLGSQFADTQNMPYLSVCTTSTHDMPTLRQWWTENPPLTQSYYNNVLHMEGDAPSQCPAEICKQIIENHLASPAMLVILPWQDWMSIDPILRNPDANAERINIPAVPDHYWQYRMHISLNQLLKEHTLNTTIKNLKRNP